MVFLFSLKGRFFKSFIVVIGKKRFSPDRPVDFHIRGGEGRGGGKGGEGSKWVFLNLQKWFLQ
jgi:hypothetical protein